jgi:single-strand DNA-binding protein
MVNTVILVGHLGKDAELISGGKGLRFTLATTSSYKDRESGERKEKTTWHTVVHWSDSADKMIPIFTKGAKAYVNGSIEYREHDDKWYTDIRAWKLLSLSPKGEAANVPNAEPAGQGPENVTGSVGVGQDSLGDDLPF